MNLANKNVLLTGASGGLGQALAMVLAAAGAKLILLGRRESVLEELRSGLPNADAHAIVAADIVSEQGRERVINFCRSVRGGVQVLINNAGVSEFGFLTQQSERSIARQMATNLLAPVLLTRRLIPFLAAQTESLIVNVGSSFGSIGFPGFSSYCASKFGLHGFSEALRRELADTAIKVIYVAPRAIRTAINSPAVETMNKALGNAMDDPALVARIIHQAMQKKSGGDVLIGWPEKLFARLNGLWPALVDAALRRQLPLIRQFAGQS